MAQFKYKARDNEGNLHESIVAADTEAAARAILSEKGYWVINISVSKAKKSSMLDLDLDEMFADYATVSLKDLVVFCRQFATMINSGVAAVRALTILSLQSESAKLRKILTDIKTNVEQGANLSDAFARHPKEFDSLFISMVKAGETAGVLDEVLNRIAKFMEDRANLTAKIKSAMAYPTVVSIAAIIIFMVMLVVILPKFSEVFNKLGTDLPAYTQFLVDVSDIMIASLKFPWSLVLISLVFCSWFGWQKLYSIESGKYIIDKIFLKLPVFGALLQKVAVARFTRTFGTLIKSGVPILTSLEIVEQSSGNAVLARAVKDVQKEVKQGSTVSTPLEKYDIFPPMVVSMIAVGEETGEMDIMLSKIADFYDSEVETAVDALTSVLEPIMMVFLGGIVGSVIVGLYLPMFKIFDSIQ